MTRREPCEQSGSDPAVPPRLTIGLPVYNGERYLAQALDALLAQTFTDFELLIADNASTDRTEFICREYAARDARIRYTRNPRNLGAVPNHNLLVERAHGELFKWASHDDLYAPDLMEACVEALDEHPEAVLAHSDDAYIDGEGRVLMETPYTMQSADPRPWVRLRGLLMMPGGNDFYGVFRTDALRAVGPHGTYYNADRTFMARLILAGPFVHVSRVLYYRRDHPQRASRAGNVRARAAALDPQRGSRLRNPVLRLYVEYLLGFVAAILRAPLSTGGRVRCFAVLASWLARHAVPGRAPRSLEASAPALVKADPPEAAALS